VIHFRVRYERLRDRVSRARRQVLLLRALWMAMLVPLAALSLRLGWGLELGRLPVLTATVVGFGAAAAWGARSGGRADPSRLLDRRFGLGELIVTAVEVDSRGPATSIEERLLDDAASAVTVIGRRRSVDGQMVRREAETALALALALAGLWILLGAAAPEAPRTRLPSVTWGALGGGAAEAGGGNGPGGGPGPGAGSGAASAPSPALSALAAALGDHAAARSMAEALESGDPSAAARLARALADRAPELTEAGRHDLADALHGAAADVADDEPDLSRALRSAGRALESPDAASAAAGVEELASELDILAARGGSLGAAAGAPEVQTREGPPAERLAAKPGASTLGAAEGGPAAAPGRTERQAAPGAAEAAAERATGGSTQSGEIAAELDPLQYPWRLRETVRRYFTRAEAR